ncbi:MAG TPA: type II toxin-antitoxin system RelE/ParE family toxin [Thermoanaerobaculia bacterium]|nr:type II toxin-antitoxin system RelE/ParE family toxin [Thermoanaerobaculia bacterium]
MAKPTRLSREALRELVEAAEWYDSRQEGLSARLLEEIQRAQNLIGERPAAFPLLRVRARDLQIRRALLSHFPYALIFVELPEEIRIIAVAHHKRRPEYWIKRFR